MIYPLIPKKLQTLFGSFFLGWINCQSISPILAGNCHAGNIRIPIADVNHVKEWDAPFFLIHVLVDILIETQFSFINSKEKLGFGGIVNRHFNALWSSVFVVLIFTSIDFFKILFDRNTV